MVGGTLFDEDDRRGNGAHLVSSSPPPKITFGRPFEVRTPVTSRRYFLLLSSRYTSSDVEMPSTSGWTPLARPAQYIHTGRDILDPGLEWKCSLETFSRRGYHNLESKLGKISSWANPDSELLDKHTAHSTRCRRRRPRKRGSVGRSDGQTTSE